MEPAGDNAIAIRPDDRVFVLTGAGVSAESGIPTFRGAGGLWRGFRIEEVASPIAWARDPETVWQFYSWRREVASNCQPNPAHRALAELEAALGDRLFLCTQNVDSLHERAGSRRVVHMHGRLMQSRCEHAGCRRPPFDDQRSYRTLAEIPRCQCGGRIRPHICWFGEVPFHLEEIFEELERATVFVCIGSSGVVEPAASFVRASRSRPNARAFYVGPEEPANSHYFDRCFEGKAGDLLPALFHVES
ncbi:MAG TPA: NAD-dependent deacylase [Terriglobales bacterium]|nr:NAD-dependent deacylase [Terriglobales bacterium]